jgi:hypothetical protein
MFRDYSMNRTIRCGLVGILISVVRATPGPQNPKEKAFPRFETVLSPATTPDLFTLKEAPAELDLSSSSTTNGGLTYLEFYSQPNCEGAITYSSGLKAGLCLPANDYVRPPFEDDDNFYYKFPFQSFMMGNVTGSMFTLQQSSLIFADVFSLH